MKRTIVLSILLALPAGAMAQVDFDRGSDIKALLEGSADAITLPSTGISRTEEAPSAAERIENARAALAELRRDASFLAADLDSLKRDAERVAAGTMQSKLFSARLKDMVKTLSGYDRRVMKHYYAMPSIIEQAGDDASLNASAAALKKEAEALKMQLTPAADSAKGLDAAVSAMPAAVIGWQNQWDALDIYGRTADLETFTWLLLKDVSKLAENTAPRP